jgi:hypothetical protein
MSDLRCKPRRIGTNNARDVPSCVTVIRRAGRPSAIGVSPADDSADDARTKAIPLENTDRRFQRLRPRMDALRQNAGRGVDRQHLSLFSQFGRVACGASIASDNRGCL